MNRDFVEMLSALSAAGVRFLIVGAHALAAHGVPRATGDLDIWVKPTIDILSGISGVEFDAAWPRRIEVEIGDLTVGTLGREDFIANKRASGRPKDLLDLELLTPVQGDR
jgi:hypothetical protein